MFRVLAVVVLLLAPSWALAQQEVRDITRLGGSTAMHKGGLKTVSELRKVAGDPQFQADVRVVLAQAGLAELSEALINTLRDTEYFVNAPDCNLMRPSYTEVIGICDSQPGQRFHWMAFRPGGKELELMHDIRWAGEKSFQTYIVSVQYGNAIYRFALPEPCVNLSLLGIDKLPSPPPVVVEPVEPKTLREKLVDGTYTAAYVPKKRPAMLLPPPPPERGICEGKGRKTACILVPIAVACGIGSLVGDGPYCGFSIGGDKKPSPSPTAPPSRPTPSPTPPPNTTPGKPPGD